MQHVTRHDEDRGEDDTNDDQINVHGDRNISTASACASRKGYGMRRGEEE
jgi:hypothetical protein